VVTNLFLHVMYERSTSEADYWKKTKNNVGARLDSIHWLSIEWREFWMWSWEIAGVYEGKIIGDVWHTSPTEDQVMTF